GVIATVAVDPVVAVTAGNNIGAAIATQQGIVGCITRDDVVGAVAYAIRGATEQHQVLQTIAERPRNVALHGVHTFAGAFNNGVRRTIHNARVVASAAD